MSGPGMLGQIATVKLVVLTGYAFLIVVFLRSRVTVNLKTHFGLYLIGLGLWQLTSFAVTVCNSASQALVWYNLQVAAGGLQSVIFLPLTRVFLGIRRYRSVDYLSYAAVVTVILLGLLQAPIQQVSAGSAGYYIPVFGGPAAATFLVAYLFWFTGVALLVRGLVREKLRLQRNRIGYLFVGALIVIAGTVTDFTPLQAYPIDTVAILINAILVSYAASRYQLVDTGTAFRRGLTVMIVGVLGVSGYVLLSFAASLIVPGSQPSNLSESGLAGFVILLGLILFVGWRTLRPTLDRLAGIRAVGHQHGLEQFSNSAHAVLDVEKLNRLLVTSAATTVGAEGGFVVCFDGAAERYTIGQVYGDADSNLADLPNVAIREFVHALHARKEPVWQQELQVNPELSYLRATCEPFFRATKAAIAVPLIQDDRLVAVLCLRSRSGTKIYGPDDFHFLSTLAKIAVSSITVADSYKRIQRQLSIQTFLFVLSESLIHNVGTGEAIHSAVEVLCSFLNIEQCFVIEIDTWGRATVHTRVELPPALERGLALVAERLAAEKRSDPAVPSSPESAESLGIDAPESTESIVRHLEFFPLISDDEWVGVLALPRRREGAPSGDWLAVSGTIRAILAHALLSVRHVAGLSALKRYNDNLLESLSAIGELIFVLDEEGTLLRVNDAVSEVLGYAATEIVGRPFSSIVDPETSKTETERLVAEALTHVVQNRVIEIRRKDNERVPVLASSSRIPEAEDSPRELVVIGRDVSEQRRLQQQLLQAQKMDSIGTMAGGIAHDFNNILTAAMGFLQVIQGELDRPDRAKEHLDIVEKSMRRAAELTQRLVSFSRASVVERKTFSINDLVTETVQLLRRSFDLAITIGVNLAPGLPVIVGDRSQIHQILVNLCVNARDAMPNGGTLSLRTSVVQKTAAVGDRGPADVSGDFVRLEIADTGEGIASQDLSRIFDPFFTTKEVGKGTGLGLSIVYGIVQSHGGHISVDSKRGKGTVFEILFPVAQSEAIQEHDPAPSSRPKRGEETLLIVDDEEPLRSLLRVVLSKSGYRVLEAADGIEAVKIFSEQSGQIDLVLIDLIMPNLGGRDTYIRLKEIDPDLKALVATGYGIDARTKELMSSGVFGIIRKPYRIQELETEIRSALDGSKS